MNTILKKINTDHYVVVDDSEIKEGDWYYDFIYNKIDKCNLYIGKHNTCKKIAHSTLYIGGFSELLIAGVKEISLQEVKELIGEVDVEKKIYFIVEKVMGSHNMKSSTVKDMISIGMSSYNQALEDNKDKKYTEEDLRKAYMVGKHGGLTQTYYEFDEYIQQLQPKTEWEVAFIDGKLKLK